MEERIVSLLSNFGLDEKKARVILFISKNALCSAGDIAREIGLTRVETYDIIKKLLQNELIEAVPGKPVKYQAKSIEEITSRIMAESMSRIKLMEESRRELLQIWRSIPSRNEKVEEKFRIIEGREQVYNTIIREADNAENKIDMILTRNDVSQLYIQGFFDKLAASKARKRLLTLIDASNADIVREVSSFVQARHSENSENGRLVIIDSKITIVSLRLDNTPGIRNEKDTAIIVYGENYARMMSGIFEVVFSNSVASKERIQELSIEAQNNKRREGMVEVLKAVFSEHGYELLANPEVEKDGKRYSFTALLRNREKEFYIDMFYSDEVESIRQEVAKTISKKMLMQDKIIIAVTNKSDENIKKLCSLVGVLFVDGSDNLASVSKIKQIVLNK